MPPLSICVLCGACTCRPQDEILIQHQGLFEERDFIHEDSVKWLKERRIIVASPPPYQTLPNVSAESAYVTGLVRCRDTQGPGGRLLEFARGNVEDINFGSNTKIVRGEGVHEVISVPEINFTIQSNPRCKYLGIHEKCLVILNQAQMAQGQVDIKIDISEPAVDFLPEMVNQLLKAYRYLQNPSCKLENAWLGGPGHDLGKELFTMPKVYFVDPLLEDHILRLRPLLKIDRTPSMGSVTYNSHLDKWQRALLLEQESHQGNLLWQWPTEILMHVTSYLTPREVRMLCYASNIAAWKLNQAGIWFKRLKSDMPWLWDVTVERILDEQETTYGTRTSSMIDWQAIYFDLQDQSIYESRKRTLSLVNRRRIWYLCQKLFRQEPATTDTQHDAIL